MSIKARAAAPGQMRASQMPERQELGRRLSERRASRSPAEPEKRPPGLRRSGEQENLRERKFAGMTEGDERAARMECVKTPERAAGQPQLRRVSSLANHFDVLPENAARPAGPERFHRGFLRGEPRGEARNGIAAASTIGNLRVGEHAMQKPIAVAREDRADARNLGRIHAQPNDIHAGSPA